LRFGELFELEPERSAAHPVNSTDRDMQILTLRVGQRIRIGTDITVVVLGVSEDGVKLRIIAPEGERIVRAPRILRSGDSASLEAESGWPGPASPPH
jgi:carbon storage regulator CsrA